MKQTKKENDRLEVEVIKEMIKPKKEKCECPNYGYKPCNLVDCDKGHNSPHPQDSWEESEDFVYYSHLVFKHCREIGSSPKSALEEQENFKKFIHSLLLSHRNSVIEEVIERIDKTEKGTSLCLDRAEVAKLLKELKNK